MSGYQGWLSQSKVDRANERKDKSVNKNTGARSGKYRCRKCGEPFDKKNRKKNHEANCQGKTYGADLDGRAHSDRTMGRD